LGEEPLQAEHLVLANAVVAGFPEEQRHRLGALAFPAQQQAVEIHERLGLRLSASEQRSKTLVQ
jgi:hypothetical protein